jgi:uncharacterized protein
MTTLTIRLDAKLEKALDRVAKSTGRTKSEIAREALRRQVAVARFLDMNVLVSAFASRGLCAEVFELVLLDHDLIFGRNVVRELEKALREKVKLPVVRSTEIIDFVSSEATQIVDRAEPAVVNVDAADSLVLGEALASYADLFVTGDAALLRLAAIGALKIVSPRQFWEVLRAGSG